MTAFHQARRTTPDGEMRSDIIAVITQRRQIASEGREPAIFRGGCTLAIAGPTRGGGADRQRGDHRKRDQHEQRRVRECDLVPTDMAEGEEVGDLKLMNRIHVPDQSCLAFGRPGGRYCLWSGGSSVVG